MSKREFFLQAIFCSSKLCREFRQLVLFGATSFCNRRRSDCRHNLRKFFCVLFDERDVVFGFIRIDRGEAFVSFSGRCFQRGQALIEPIDARASRLCCRPSDNSLVFERSPSLCPSALL
jgi:hypothetical protein